jgi:hypothetical protein
MGRAPGVFGCRVATVACNPPLFGLSKRGCRDDVDIESVDCANGVTLWALDGLMGP